MRYRCKICGTPGEGKTFPVSCPACGASGFEKRQFDAKCPKCGQGYFKEDNPVICTVCGKRLVDPKPEINRPAISPPPRKRTVSPPKPVPPPRRRPVPTPPPRPPTVRHSPHSGGSSIGAVLSILKFIVLIPLCLVASVIACFVIYIVVVQLWDVLCFIGRHWIISLIVFFFIVGCMDKS